MLTHAEYSVKIGGWGRGREDKPGRGPKPMYHPGRGDHGDLINRSDRRKRAYKARIDRYYQAAQEQRDQAHKRATRAFYANKRRKK